jgi:hypothetical protein
MGGAALLLVAQFAFAAATLTRVDYDAALDRATAVYKDASAKCEPMAGHNKDMCVVEAKAVEKRAKASADANYQDTNKAKTDSRIADADADFMVAKVACDTKAGAERNICVKQAEATQIKLVADAKAHRTSVDALADAREDTRDAQRRLALTKCDAMPGTEKDSCVTAAKSTYGK